MRLSRISGPAGAGREQRAALPRVRRERTVAAALEAVAQQAILPANGAPAARHRPPAPPAPRCNDVNVQTLLKQGVLHMMWVGPSGCSQWPRTSSLILSLPPRPRGVPRPAPAGRPPAPPGRPQSAAPRGRPPHPARGTAGPSRPSPGSIPPSQQPHAAGPSAPAPCSCPWQPQPSPSARAASSRILRASFRSPFSVRFACFDASAQIFDPSTLITSSRPSPATPSTNSTRVNRSSSGPPAWAAAPRNRQIVE